MDEKPITEQSNVKSANIDIASPQEMVNILSTCDGEIFTGYKSSGGLLHENTISKMEKISQVTSALLLNPEKSAIVLSGCGTSGRLAFMLVSTFNLKLQSIGKSPCFQYLIAGKDEALFTSQEAIEDDPQSGQRELQELVKGKEKVLYIGITCGLSAPYVGGQIEYSLEHLDFTTPVLLGFNPVGQARNTPVEKWDKTMRLICEQLEMQEKLAKGFVLNPVVGPEAITGSSRMKGGSATKILLESIFTSAFMESFPAIFKTLSNPGMSHLIKSYASTKASTYNETPLIAKAVEVAGNCLLNNGHIYYISDERCGVVGLIDASECPPTFCADLSDVRGFLKDGYSAFQNKEGDLSHKFDISQDCFLKDVVPSLTANDVIIAIQQWTNSEIILSSPAKLITLSVSGRHKSLPKRDDMVKDVEINVSLPREELREILGENVLEFLWPFLVEMSLKWLCNDISTGSFVMKGKVYKNYMIDLKASNNKLFHRAVGIVQEIGNCSSEEGKSNLLRAIYNLDDISCEIFEAPISSHVAIATPLAGVVPIAIVMAKQQCSLSAARDILKEYPIVRHAIESLN